MTEPTPVFYVIFAAAVLMIGMGKGGLGAAFASLATSLLAMILPVEMVLALVLVAQMMADIFAVGAHWRRWDTKLAARLIPGALAGVAMGTFFITSVSPQALRTTLAVVILLFTLYKVLERSLLRGMTYTPRPWHSPLAGGISGFASAVANNGGPPVTIYLLLHNLQPRTFIATTAIFFLILNYIKLPFYLSAGLFDWGLLRSALPLLILAPIGVWIGKAFVLRVNKEAYERENGHSSMLGPVFAQHPGRGRPCPQGFHPRLCAPRMGGCLEQRPLLRNLRIDHRQPGHGLEAVARGRRVAGVVVVEEAVGCVDLRQRRLELLPPPAQPRRDVDLLPPPLRPAAVLADPANIQEIGSYVDLARQVEVVQRHPGCVKLAQKAGRLRREPAAVAQLDRIAHIPGQAGQKRSQRRLLGRAERRRQLDQHRPQPVPQHTQHVEKGRHGLACALRQV